MKFFFFTYMAIFVWFFFWLRPRVEDGRIEQIFDKAKHWYKYRLKGSYHWRYVPSFWRERIQDRFYPWFNYRRIMLKKYINKKRNKTS